MKEPIKNYIRRIKSRPFRTNSDGILFGYLYYDRFDYMERKEKWFVKTVCELNQCNGCMACVEKCPKQSISIVDSIRALNATIDEQRCIHCNVCKMVCPRISFVKGNKPIEWKQGWAVNEIRRKSSSGGAAFAIIKSFIEKGGYVASCLFKDGQFLFDITNDLEYAKNFSGSKYVKSNPTGIYKKIQKLLEEKKVLFIGLPCQVAGLKNFIVKQENLYTIDLVCHGTPSEKLLEKYLYENGYSIKKLQNIQFRKNTEFGIFVDQEKIAYPKVMDDYLCTFLTGINYTENCYSCRFASIERVSDITLGDSWGSEYLEEEHAGISLILIQSIKGKELMNDASIELKDVCLESAIYNNHQLSEPSSCPRNRSWFMNMIEKDITYKKASLLTIPFLTIKQRIKSIFVLFHLIKINNK